MTIFDTKLKQVMRKDVTKASLHQLDELQEAFKRLGHKSQTANLGSLRDAATASNGLDDLADLLENVAKPKPSGGSRPAVRRRNSPAGGTYY